ncbi:MAG TPA: hydroxyisourate hydrolase, partial [Deltaproteobacteria bacterium]|nr:hydroxyisourate hydrolase [Deltaproteobacteria bacterium]
GVYRMLFETGPYFEQQGTAYFYPEIEVRFLLNHPEQHYHIPLLLSPFGYSTYRGS